MAGREPAESEQRHRHRCVDSLGELTHFLHRAALENALAGENNRSLRRRDQFNGLPDLTLADGELWAIPPHLYRSRIPFPTALRLLRVLGDVHEHWTRTARLGEVKRFLDRRHDVFDARHQVAVLGDRQRDAGDVGFLKCVVANELARHLTRDAHHRDRVHLRSGDACDEVRRPGT